MRPCLPLCQRPGVDQNQQRTVNSRTVDHATIAKIDSFSEKSLQNPQFLYSVGATNLDELSFLSWIEFPQA